MIEVFRNDFFVVRTDSPSLVVEVTRSNAAFRSALEAASAFKPMLACLDGLGRHRYALLFDARDSVANNHPDYESWYARFRTDLVRDFARIAILMRTPVGALQAARLLPATSGVARVFLDREQAWSFLTAPSAPPTSRRPPPNSATPQAPNDATPQANTATPQAPNNATLQANNATPQVPYDSTPNSPNGSVPDLGRAQPLRGRSRLPPTR